MHLTRPLFRARTTASAITMATFPGDCLPPERYSESRQALFELINAWAKPRGYAFTTLSSTKEKNGTSTVIYACDRSGDPPRGGERQRRMTTRKTNCPFSVIAKETTDGGWAPQLLLEPRQRIEPFRTQSSLPRSSTKREPSQFEVVEAKVQAVQPRRAPSKCTKCHAVGHTRTSRACPLRYSDVL
jgi:hypothetical protein